MGSSSKSKPTPGASGVILQTDTQKYRQKYKELKRKVREIEAQNDKLALKTLTVKRNIQRLRLERSILYERLEKNLHQNQLLDPSRASTQMGGSITGTNGNQLDSNRFDRFPPPPSPHQSLQHPNHPQHQHQHQPQHPHDSKPQGTSLQLPSLPTDQPFAIPSNSRFSTADHPHAHGPSNPNPNPVESMNVGNPSLQNQNEGQMEGNGASGSGNRMKITLKRSGP